MDDSPIELAHPVTLLALRSVRRSPHASSYCFGVLSFVRFVTPHSSTCFAIFFAAFPHAPPLPIVPPCAEAVSSVSISWQANLTRMLRSRAPGAPNTEPIPAVMPAVSRPRTVSTIAAPRLGCSAS